MHVLFATSEVAGYYKLGGLADVSRSLPEALSHTGIGVDIVMPYYHGLKTQDVKCIGKVAIETAQARELVFIFRTKLPNSGVNLLLPRHPELNDYNAPHMAYRFAFFNLIIKQLYLYAPHITGYNYDIIHCQDWHTSLVPVLVGEDNKVLSQVRSKYRFKPGSGKMQPTLESRGVKTVLTIHNLLYQGEIEVSNLHKLNIKTGLLHEYRHDHGKFVRGLREGLEHADMVTTVSPTYAKELTGKEFGGHLSATLKLRRKQFFGILNGIDNRLWNPASDNVLSAKFNASNYKSGKPICKKDLQRNLGLPQIADMPLVGFIGRLEPKQKGIELIRQSVMAPAFGNYQLVILGTGNEREVSYLTDLSRKHRNLVFINKFDEALARKIYAGCDIMVVPSRFEPCGLIQMIAMRYGTIPLVRATGGLADTVIDGVTGFVFKEYSAGALNTAFDRVLTAYKQPNYWSQIVKNVFTQDFSWDRSAREYISLYRQLLD